MEIVDNSEVRSEEMNVRVGEKREVSSDDDVEVRVSKKARNCGQVKGNLKRVAEIVLVLETLGKMRGGRSPTQVESEMMSEARGKLAEVCREFKPKDVFPREAFGVVIDDLGLSKNEQMLGFRAPNIQIAQKLKLTQEKIGKSEEFAVHSALHSSQRLQANVGAASESGSSHAVRMLTSQKPSQASTASVGLQPASQLARVAATNSTALPYQLPTSEVRPLVPGEIPSSHVGRDSSSLALARAERPHFSSDIKYNGAYPSQAQVNSSGHGRPLSWSVQPPQSTLSVKNASNSSAPINASVKVEGAAEMSRVIPQTSKSITGQTVSVNPPSVQQHIQQGIESAQALSLRSQHTDIANLVQKLLQPTLHERPIWAPPSRDYMNKSLACQLCKLISLEVDNVLVCDGCEKGYHLKCLKINNQKSVPRGEWHCAKCLSLSNGKALPPKYGRVLRNAITAPKVSSNATTVHIPPENKLGALAGKVAGNGNVGIQDAPGGSMDNNIRPFAAGAEMTDKRVIHKEIDDKSSGCVSTDIINTSALSSAGLSVGTSDDKKLIAQSASYHPADPQSVKSSSSNTINPSTNCPVINFKVNDLQKYGPESNDEAKRDEQGTLHTNHVEVSKTNFGPNEQDVNLSDGLHQVDWIGDILNVVGEKTFYQSCSINGVVYKVHDHALFRLQSNILTPFKLQSMWEDCKTRSMWVIASRCYFPADLPKGVGRPFAPDNSEVYESNHDTAIRAGLIEGPCKVLPPRLFAEESQKKTRLGMEASGGPQPLFVCKWFFDERKGLFRDVTS
ncbi:RING/FYVE/PHD zinc finger superfamily protein [Heracleum sosnowskyi]|uniref:RING/FYVE/PHD zinc finger superfamily protein n=1 Tax=Heracleum sosnowskyi TaxID=360622 RepID=A0AAD8NE75_9APIA|nr:RING/FYVE/PHD zinc finger superfamily protein [Heracleum sosnowskyi]